MGEWNGSRILLRGLRARADKREFLELRAANAGWTRPWDSTAPGSEVAASMSFAQMVHFQDGEARDGRLLPFAVEVDGVLAGQMHLFGISRGALLSASAGYWIAERYAGRAITPFALALLIDHAFGPVGLHRVEVNIRPDNARSLRVVAKLGLREEGLRRRYLHINGAWHDHVTFAVTTEELPTETMVERFRRRVTG
ncbi:GNAT family N-acetyltransferase [Flexivirga caeni]|uniref:N-acetyltransferase n=1 Tax=Flexivirga caeni TaxID=2294115 RepID=A0A3M9ME96_9MICO|nr:GNAT family protein [Flexivirga caeni]RNI23890.1 N-acetyltransferase [Flexivirga caeni]